MCCRAGGCASHRQRLQRCRIRGARRSFGKRGKIIEEQVELLWLLWTREVVDYDGAFHKVSAAGINPLPSSGRFHCGSGVSRPRSCAASGAYATAGFPSIPTSRGTGPRRPRRDPLRARARGT